MAPLDTLEGYALLPIEELHESKLNPRKHFDKAALEELAGSIAAKGILTPLLVRPNAKGFEVGAGHRRLRAAKIAGLGQLPCVVRQMSDADFLELIVVENDQREDVHPLEQAEGYKRLMLLDGYDAKRIADRIGRSEKFVYDRMKLLGLVPLAQQLFLAGKMMAGHAILLARLTPEQQQKAIAIDKNSWRDRSGLFTSESAGLFDDDEREGKATKKDPLGAFEGCKPVSVRELDGWIAEHIRFDPKKADAFLFPAVVEAVSTAPKDLVPLSWENSIADDARDPKVRTWRPGTWKEVKDPAKACKYTQAGIIVVGPGRGDVLQVCLNSHRDQCKAHWSKESKAAEQARKQRARYTGGGRSSGGGGATDWQKQEAARNAEEAKLAAENARWVKAAPAIVRAVVARIEAASIARVAQAVLAHVEPDRWTKTLLKIGDYHTPGKTADSLLRHAAMVAQLGDLASYRAKDYLVAAAKTWGVADVVAIVDTEAPKPKPEKKPTAEKPTAKKAAKK